MKLIPSSGHLHPPVLPSRRTFCGLLAAVGARERAARGAAAGPILVVSATGTEAYAQAIEGIRAGLANTVPLEFVDIARKPQLDGLARTLAAKQPRAVIAIGTEAMTAVAGYAGNTPVIATMILLSDSEKAVSDKAQPPRLAGCVSLDLSVTAVCREWKQLVPGKTRVGIIRNPRKNGPLAAAVDAQASSAGCSARIVECSRPEDLLAAFLSLKNQVDFVWCMPDSALYTSATVKPLLMASLEQRLPLVGFSESFVRVGATMGVYPDFLDVGRQTAEVARKWLAGEPFASAQVPRIVRVAFNHRVARLMGLRYTLPPEGDGRVMVLK